jgi:hypothetical protein
VSFDAHQPTHQVVQIIIMIRRIQMAINVAHGKEEITTHTDAIKWVIDEDGRLHIVGANGNLASYNNGCWANVYTETPKNS